MGLARRRLVSSWARGWVLAVSALRSEVVALRLVLQKSKADIRCCASSQQGVGWLQQWKPRPSSGNCHQQASLWQHLVALHLCSKANNKYKAGQHPKLLTQAKQPGSGEVTCRSNILHLRLLAACLFGKFDPCHYQVGASVALALLLLATGLLYLKHFLHTEQRQLFHNDNFTYDL